MNTLFSKFFTRQAIKQESEIFFSAVLITLLSFGGTYAYSVYAANPEVETLTVTIAESVTFTVSTNVFGTLTPGTFKIATSTTDVLTNASAWNITLYGNNQGSGVASTTLYLSPTTYTTTIADQREWAVFGIATTATPTYPAVIRTALDNSQKVLAFRVMTASGSIPFRSTTWWGASDADGVALWAGIASSTSQQKIGSVNGYSSTDVINSIQYYLDVPSTQTAGAYTGDLTYTWVTGV